MSEAEWTQYWRDRGLPEYLIAEAVSVSMGSDGCNKTTTTKEKT